jgi:hypothetical protein
MEAVAALAFVLVLVCLLGLIYSAVTRLGSGNVRKRLRNARWEVADWSDADTGYTHVVVCKLTGVGDKDVERYDTREVTQISNGAADYADRLLAARAEADQRASALNSG